MFNDRGDIALLESQLLGSISRNSECALGGSVDRGSVASAKVDHVSVLFQRGVMNDRCAVFAFKDYVTLVPGRGDSGGITQAVFWLQITFGKNLRRCVLESVFCAHDVW